MVIFLVFYISQTTLGTWIADWLVAWIETFQEWVGGMMENANPLLYAILVDVSLAVLEQLSDFFRW